MYCASLDGKLRTAKYIKTTILALLLKKPVLTIMRTLSESRKWLILIYKTILQIAYFIIEKDSDRESGHSIVSIWRGKFVTLAGQGREKNQEAGHLLSSSSSHPWCCHTTWGRQAAKCHSGAKTCCHPRTR